MLKKFLPKILIALSLLFPFASFAEPGGDLNLNNKASLVSRDGNNLVLGTEGDDDVLFIQNNTTTFSIDGATGAITFTGTLTPLLPNNTYLKSKNAAGNADINVLGVDTSDDTVLNADTGDVINFAIGGTAEAVLYNDELLFTGSTATVTGTGALRLRVGNDLQRNIAFNSSSDTALTMTFGDGGTTAGQTFSLTASTADADDDSILNLASGGATGITRGAYSTLAGNESSDSGAYRIFSGNFATADVSIAAQDDFIVETLAGTDALVIDTATGDTTLPIGNLTLSTSGKTIVIQENTASTACLGVTTPNGTTPVTVTTSCAASGARILYSRNGAITNVGAVTTTTAPNGTSFAFASTNASDTTTSVVWFIIKEAA